MIICLCLLGVAFCSFMAGYSIRTVQDIGWRWAVPTVLPKARVHRMPDNTNVRRCADVAFAKRQAMSTAKEQP